jgi:hypothetical protein
MAHSSHRCDYDKKTIDSKSVDCSNCAVNVNDLDVGKMSDYIEIIHPQSMTAKLLCNGVVVEEYKIEQCDKCSQLKRLDQFGYQKGYDRTENIIWFCGDCR